MNIFISYNSKDGAIVNKIANDLNVQKDCTILYDQLFLEPGKNWIAQLEQALKETKAGLIFIGDYGIGNWQEIEIVNLLNTHHSQNNFLLIPVMLPTQGDNLYNNLPFYLKNIQWFQYNEDQHQHCIASLLNEIRNNRESIRFNEANPYKGLKAFEKEDALYYFGRTFEINRFFNQKCNFAQGIKPGVNNFCAIVANSGDGKSSFVKAGILAALANSKFENSENWIPVITNPGNNAIEKLCIALYDVITPKTFQTLKTPLGDKINTRQLEQDILNYEDALARTLRETTKQTIVIYIDQFEEILTNHPIGESTKVGVVEVDNETIIQQYLNNIDRARKEENVVIVISLRADFANRFTFHSVFNMLLENHRFNLSTLNLSKVDNRQETTALLTEIIKMPAELNGVEIHNNVVQQIINDCKGLANVLPILQLLMNKLWESYLVNKQTGKPTITTHIYNELTHNKGLQGYINIHADKVYQYLVQENPDNATHIKQIFIPHLISLNTANTDGDLRRIATKAEIVKGNAKKEALLHILSAENTRLLYIKEAHKDNATVEVIHEVLIREWQLLQKWIEAERDILKKKALYETLIHNKPDIIDYVKWIEVESDNLNKKTFYESLIQNSPNYILKGADLQKAKKWQMENEHLHTNQITQFLQNSIAAQKVRKRWMGFIIAMVTISMLIFTPFMWEFYKYNNLVLSGKAHEIKDKKIVIDNEDDYNLLYNKLYFYSKLNTLVLNSLSFDTLRKIRLSKSYYTLKLKNIQSLSSISITNCKFENLNIFEEPNNITLLEIYRNNSLEKINSLGGLSNLTNLTISNNGTLSEIIGLEKLSNLTNLVIHANHTFTKVGGLEGLDNLTELAIIGSYALTKIRGLEGLNNLSNLKIYDNAALTEIKELDSLDSVKTLFTDSKLILSTILKNSKNLNKIETTSETILASDLDYDAFQQNYLGIDYGDLYDDTQLSIDFGTLKNNFKHIDTLVIKGDTILNKVQATPPKIN